MSNYHIFIGSSLSQIPDEGDKSTEIIYITEGIDEGNSELTYLVIILVYSNFENVDIVDFIKEEWNSITNDKIDITFITNEEKHINKNFIKLINDNEKGEVLFKTPLVSYLKDNNKAENEAYNLILKSSIKKKFLKDYLGED